MLQSALDIWVGVFPKTGALVVYDPLLQLDGQTEVNVYSVARETVRRFQPAEIRAIVQTVHGADREQAVAAYLAWRLLNGSDFLEKERRRMEREQEEAERDSALRTAEASRLANLLIERHKAHLVAIGKEYRGAAVRPSKARQAHCWNCRESLSSNIDLACLACSWMLCTCGACGCRRVT